MRELQCIGLPFAPFNFNSLEMVDNEKQAGPIFFDILEGERQQPA